MGYFGSCGWISYPLSLESLVPEYSAFGVIREPAGSALPGIAPTNAYRCADAVVLIAGNGNSIFKRLMQAIGRDDLGNNPALAENAGRVARVDELDRAIEAWTCERAVAEVLQRLADASVPAGRVYTAKEIVEDPHSARATCCSSRPRATGMSSKCRASCPSCSARRAAYAARLRTWAVTPTRFWSN